MCVLINRQGSTSNNSELVKFWQSLYIIIYKGKANRRYGVQKEKAGLEPKLLLGTWKNCNMEAFFCSNILYVVL